jgi:type 1 fimbriae regulatory protein FimB
MMFRHGLRMGEALSLQLSSLDLEGKTIHLKRLKNGISGAHPLLPDEMAAIKAWIKERETIVKKASTDLGYLFCSPHGGKLSDAYFRVFFPKLGREAGLSFHVHPHMLRHSCGYALANLGNDTRLIQSYLGHRTIQQTVRYTEVNPMRFGTIWGRKTRWAA